MNIEKVVIKRENIMVRAIQNIINKVDKEQRKEELEFEEKIPSIGNITTLYLTRRYLMKFSYIDLGTLQLK